MRRIVSVSNPIKAPIAPNYKGVNPIHVNPIHAILKYGNYYDFMDR